MGFGIKSIEGLLCITASSWMGKQLKEDLVDQGPRIKTQAFDSQTGVSVISIIFYLLLREFFEKCFELDP